ncbi:MAG TPA: 50S ribosomal protein L24 [Phycisphaerae bacterium]|nr:50S ribosomal protein L24 [Phycisphaerae bacterium]
MAAKIRKNDRVEVICGDHKGEQGRVLRVIREKSSVVIEGVNLVFRHLRPSRTNPQGGRIRKEAPIHVSNVMPVDPKTSRGGRVRFETEIKNGKVVSKKRMTVGGSVVEDIKPA